MSLVTAAAGCVVAVALGLLVVRGSWSLLALLLAVIVLLVLQSNFKVGSYALVLFSFVQLTYINRFYYDLPALFAWLPHLAVSVLLLGCLLSKQPIHTKLPKGSVQIMLAIGAITLLSTVFNRVPLLVAAMGLLQFFPLFSCLLVLTFMDEHEKRRIQQMLLGLGLLQLPVALLQRFVFFRGGDGVAGTLSGTTGLAFFVVFCFLYVLDEWLYDRSSTRNALLKLSALLLTLALSNTTGAFVFLVISGSWYLLQNLLRRRILGSRVRVLLLPLLILPLLWGAAGLYNAIFAHAYGYSVTGRFTSVRSVWEYSFGSDPTAPEKQLAKDGSLLRGSAVLFNWRLIRSSVPSVLLGLGPGNVSESAIGAAEGRYSKLYPGFELGGNTLSTLLGEFGLLGIGILICIGLSLYFPPRHELNARGPVFPSIQLYRSVIVLVGVMLIYYGVLRNFPAPLILASLYPHYYGRNMADLQVVE